MGAARHSPRECWCKDSPMRLLQEVLGAIAAAAQRVEAAFDGQPQDIEGVWVDGKLTVVQSRPQVL